MGVTIKDVAKKTGLSITTISLVLNKKENRIPEKTRQLVETAVQELNYAPNQAAISLSTKKTNLFVLIIPRKTFYPLTDMVSSIESSCRNAGFGLNISLPEGDDASCLEAIREALRRGTDGIIVDPSVFSGDSYATYLDLVLKSEIPICSLAGAGAHLLPNSIVPDHRQGGYLAASHLLDLGHTGIGFAAGPRENYVVLDLLQGIEGAFEEHRTGSGAFSEGALFAAFGENTAASGYEGLETLLNERSKEALTGIIASSANIAAGILRRADELRITVPGQLSVICYGNCPPADEYLPPLSTVSIHYDRMARKAVNLIKKLNQGGLALTPELIPPSLILRGSTGRINQTSL
jgi:LacI family transcriptional regulator